MLNLIKGLPENIIGVSAQGRVSAEDYKNVLIPAVDAALKKHNKVRFLYELGAEFSGMELGAMWEDFSYGMGHLGKWERIAVVTDNDWIKHATQALGFMIPCPIKVFKNSELTAAKGWIAA